MQGFLVPLWGRAGFRALPTLGTKVEEIYLFIRCISVHGREFRHSAFPSSVFLPTIP